MIDNSFESPDPKSIQKAVKIAGGFEIVSKKLRKTSRAVRYWTDGKRKIDFANWVLLRRLADVAKRR